MALRIGITGGIGSGKSTVAAVFELLGVPVYYADAATKNLYHTLPELQQKVKNQFGENMYVNGILNRAALAAAVFGDSEKLALLNSIVHPLTMKDAEVWMNKQTAPYVLKEAALLFESGSAAPLHFIIGVQSPVALRIQRVMQRDGLTAAEIEQRMARQMNEEEKMKKCDYIVTNDEQSLVIPQVMALHELLLAKAGAAN